MIKKLYELFVPPPPELPDGEVFTSYRKYDGLDYETAIVMDQIYLLKGGLDKLMVRPHDHSTLEDYGPFTEEELEQLIEALDMPLFGHDKIWEIAQRYREIHR